MKVMKSRVRFSPNSGPSLLKWLNSLYRPALPEESARLRRFPVGSLGRRQVVRQGILIPPCGGSNPPAPAMRFIPRRGHVRKEQIDLRCLKPGHRDIESLGGQKVDQRAEFD